MSHPFDTYLTFQRPPIKSGSHMRIGGNLVTFVTIVIGEKLKHPIDHPLQQHHPGMRPSLRIDGGEGHDSGFISHQSNSLGKPLRKLQEGVGH